VISESAKQYVLRLIDSTIKQKYTTNGEFFYSNTIVRKNSLTNLARRIQGRPVREIWMHESGDDVENSAMHENEFWGALTPLNTPQFVEFMIEVMDDNWLEVDLVNQLLRKENLSFQFLQSQESTSKRKSVSVKIIPLEVIQEAIPNAHENISVLVGRMNLLLDNADYSGVLHASASAFEVLAKEVCGDLVDNKPLGKFFKTYREKSQLSDEILNYINKIYIKRGDNSLAGHGKLKSSNITREEAVIIMNFTKAIIRIEYQLSFGQ
ncbi:MAG: hypothetical protein AAF267_21370, partial [Deinococcota bacterium]